MTAQPAAPFSEIEPRSMESSDIPPLNSPSSAGAVDDWQVSNWSVMVQVALGFKAMLIFNIALIAVLVPGLLLAIYGVCSFRPLLVVDALLAWVGFRNRSTFITGIPVFASLCVAAGGLVCGLVYNDGLLFAAGLVPGATWLGACIVLGVTGQYVIEKIGTSEDTLDLLVQRRLLQPISNRLLAEAPVQNE